MRTPTTTWKRLTRRLGRDGNPLRRRSDVIDAWLLPVAIVVFLALCPLVLALTGNWMRTANANEHRAQANWHHVQASYSRDDSGWITYHSVWLDGVESTINETVFGAASLGWGPTINTQFQVDGLGSSGSTTVYVDSLTISRW